MPPSSSTIDYYSILGIERDATSDEIKKAYRKEALKWHPDKNGDQRLVAEERFKLISEAYQVLQDTDKKRIYDVYGREGLERGAGPSSSRSNRGRDPFPSMFRSPEDIFREFFGGQDIFSSFFGRPSNMSSSSAFQNNDPFNSPFFSPSPFDQMRNQHAAMHRQHEQRMMGGMGFPSMFGNDPFFSDPFFSSSSSSTSTSFGHQQTRGVAGPGRSTSRQTVIVNGVRQTRTTITTTDAEGNVQVETIQEDGSGNVSKQITFNGQPQSQRLLQ